MSKKKPDPEEMLTVREAALAMGGVNGSLVRRFIANKRLPATKIGGIKRAGLWLIRRGDLDLLKGRKVGYPRGRPRKEQKDAKGLNGKRTTNTGRAAGSSKRSRKKGAERSERSKAPRVPVDDR
jgi:hypothetical protein